MVQSDFIPTTYCLAGNTLAKAIPWLVQKQHGFKILFFSNLRMATVLQPMATQATIGRV